MAGWAHAMMAFWAAWVFALGLGVGSFVNVLIARLPFEKSVIWPSSRCFTCFAPIRLLDNLPVVGYLRLRGRCRACGVPFSARYLWVEVGTGLAFLALFSVEIALQAEGGPVFLRPWQFTPGLRFPYLLGTPPAAAAAFIAVHGFLMAALIAAAVIDFRHRIIPAQITYVGTAVGILAATLFPWPWPSDDPAILRALANPNFLWRGAPVLGGAPIPEGLTVWPFWAPQFEFAPFGSTLHGLLNGLIGAAAGMAIGRGVKTVFELGLNKEALGLGDADLLMMGGAFLGWQAIALALPVGAMLTLFVVVPAMLWRKVRGRPTETHLPFGPGIAAGIAGCWFGWPFFGEAVRAVFFDEFLLAFLVVGMGGGMLAAGFLLRRRSG